MRLRIERHINVILFIHKDNLKGSDGNALELTKQKNLQIVCCLKKKSKSFFVEEIFSAEKILKNAQYFLHSWTNCTFLEINNFSCTFWANINALYVQTTTSLVFMSIKFLKFSSRQKFEHERHCFFSTAKHNCHTFLLLFAFSSSAFWHSMADIGASVTVSMFTFR